MPTPHLPDDDHGPFALAWLLISIALWVVVVAIVYGCRAAMR